MDLTQIIDFLTHLDVHIADLIGQYGFGVYAILFLIIFLETGAVVMAILPGDSLLVGAGAFAATGDLSLFVLLLGFFLATVAGDSLNFHIGRYFGRKYRSSRFEDRTLFKFINKENFEKVQGFFDHNGRRLFLGSRFVPVARALTPFTAGFTQADFRHISPFLLLGNAFWTGLYVSVGFFFGQMSGFQGKFHYLILLIFLISMLPATVYFIRRQLKKGE
ncbi:VTT domain-containing protein [Proteiniclasticum sp. BAD-10]|uniref:VTT domain-containing protein n=1 Tax=Proteiniclasticum sediminis TaxID=2804028 RepID=A0A941CRI7_9CLOT|nr:VTT domain-containing protein [Proteiniclasticum sediminis]MBR0576819.1 VTT domain-containing protein [Proteiniclasticum sediminis]